MNPNLIEQSYPIDFRKDEAQSLGNHIKNRRSVVLAGMKRVGISNFLRFFLYHDEIAKKYLDDKNYFIVPVDLNDLVEREIYPFWVLTFKRLADAVEKRDMPQKIKKQIDFYFSDSIQSQDLFLTIDFLRKSLVLLCDQGYLPTIFLIRFDRMKDALSHDLFANIQGLLDATHNRLSYIFTSARALDHIEPSIFTRQEVLVFSDNVYVKPAKKIDAQIIFNSSIKQYNLKLNGQAVKELLRLVDGHAQYLLFALISLKELGPNIKTNELFEFLKKDERISLQSEELWESLTSTEQDILLKIVGKKGLSDKEFKQAEYLINTGFFDSKTLKIFSPIFNHFIKTKAEEKKKEKGGGEFSKKENLLLTFLEENKNEICEREQIIEAVWPETESLGVTDWAIDRLVARVRNKLKDRDKNYEIVTIKTRGYKLIDK
ncbi:MAG: winged helix-turn-helix domain-containing protein [Candidatus Levybacteria bacterium]|nr:winged helix-turn-helix domain-containing protein [Candidatus Levybacteria bacterium]